MYKIFFMLSKIIMVFNLLILLDELIVTNQSQLNLNVLLYVEAPFYLIDKKKMVHKRKIILMDGSTTSIPVKFSPKINYDNPYSRNYSSILWFEYDEHPNKVR